ncbi:hypothetical protein CHU98_g3139 [Xylaria longipes]|nr:hypothetical protein CHU98_g3139 [Xylaria longipes]
MAKAANHSSRNEQADDVASHNAHPNAAPPRNEEHQGLLAGRESDGDDGHDEDEDGFIVHPGREHDHDHDHDHHHDIDHDHDIDLDPDADHDSLGPRTPRTPNRVRFDLRPTNIPAANGNGTHDSYFAAEPQRDSFDFLDAEDPMGRERTARRPLLTDIEAPSVTVANSLSTDDVHSWAERRAQQQPPHSHSHEDEARGGADAGTAGDHRPPSSSFEQTRRQAESGGSGPWQGVDQAGPFGDFDPAIFSFGCETTTPQEFRPLLGDDDDDRSHDSSSAADQVFGAMNLFPLLDGNGHIDLAHLL